MTENCRNASSINQSYPFLKIQIVGQGMFDLSPRIWAWSLSPYFREQGKQANAVIFSADKHIDCGYLCRESSKLKMMEDTWNLLKATTPQPGKHQIQKAKIIWMLWQMSPDIEPSVKTIKPKCLNRVPEVRTKLWILKNFSIEILKLSSIIISYVQSWVIRCRR